MRLNNVMVHVTDIPRARDFYRTLGLELIVESDHYCRFLSPDGDSTFSIHLADSVPDSPITIYFECDDVDATRQNLISAGLSEGGETLAEPVDQPWLWREVHLRDPDGNRLCLFHAGENRINPPWRIRTDS